MTYALLKGLGQSNLETVPGLAAFDAPPNADRDHDRVITTEELRWYVATTLPVLAHQFPTLVQRAGRPLANLDQSPRIQASDSSFSLIELPDEAAGSAGKSQASRED
jgi:hypothetical protein